jgi:hypothetical protein
MSRDVEQTFTSIERWDATSFIAVSLYGSLWHGELRQVNNEPPTVTWTRLDGPEVRRATAK